MEAVSFVNPARVPQMAGAEEVIDALTRRDFECCGLVLNQRGYLRAVAAGVDRVHFAFACTETFNRKNAGSTVEQALATAEGIIRDAHADGLGVGVTIGAAFGCPFEGRVDPGRVLELALRLDAAGPEEITFADTIGVAAPRQVFRLVGASAACRAQIGVHLHNTRNTGYANAYAAVEAGAVIVDASVGGVGGCPFAPGATGNIATEDLVYLLEGNGIATGIDLDSVLRTVAWLAELLGHEPPGQLLRAGRFPRPR